MNIDHIGVVTKSIDKSINEWKVIYGYRQFTHLVINTKQKVKVVFLKKEGSVDIKLIEPTDETSPIYKFALRGGGLHHLCFKTDNIHTSIQIMNSQKCMTISPPQPGEAFENENIAFLLAPGNLNIELIDTEKRAGIIYNSDIF